MGKIYLKPKTFLEDYNKSIELGKPTDNLISHFTKIARRFGAQFDNINKIDFDACVNYAVTEAWIKWYKYDSQRTDNIFSFFTTMLANDMRLHYKQLNKGKELRISIDSLLSSNDK